MHSTGHKYEPILFIFGMGIGYGKISTPIVFGGFRPTCGANMGQNVGFQGNMLVCALQVTNKQGFILYLVCILQIVNSGNLLIFVGLAPHVGQIWAKRPLWVKFYNSSKIGRVVPHFEGIPECMMN